MRPERNDKVINLFLNASHIDGEVMLAQGIMIWGRQEGNLDVWKKRDPIERLVKAALNNDLFSETDFAEINSEIKTDIERSWKQALKDPFPKETQLLDTVYKKS